MVARKAVFWRASEVFGSKAVGTSTVGADRLGLTSEEVARGVQKTGGSQYSSKGYVQQTKIL